MFLMMGFPERKLSLEESDNLVEGFFSYLGVPKEWMNNYLENLQRLSRDKISKAEKKNLRFFEDEDEETYKIIWK